MLTSLKIVEKSGGVSKQVSTQVRVSAVDTPQVAYMAWAKTVMGIARPALIQIKMQLQDRIWGLL